ncbi:glycosyltransferase family 4 protein [Marinobacter sp. F4206]|uniref:glycosyltransferase family 4 protein n=1 Tax=Marinobacter sp. F4206 TaxID=2861777 RepID=UPI001C5EACE1|nr:glycosyltransferase family 4 protein [Marinobacter sp. F4206]MBW4933807.1 glycosyltransferase family 4 protein [Marinobacter sp. F4206]
MITPAVWFPTVQTGTGTDVFTRTLVDNLNARGIRAEITWLPHRAEYCPWSVRQPQAPDWSNIVHANTWLNSRLLPKGMPLVVTVHHTVHRPALRKQKGILRALYHQFWIAPNERRMLRLANQATAVSEFAADATRKDLVDRPIRVIYNGINTDRFYPEPRDKGSDPFRLLYAGSWISRKGIDLLQPIMQKLGPGFELLYTGPQEGRVHGNTRDIGQLVNEEQVVQAMQSADALLFPSRSEGFGLVVVEALSSGLPVVTSEIAPITEIIRNGVDGFLCPVNDTDEFAKAIKRLKEDSERYRQISKSGRQRALDRFSLETMMKQYVELYSNMLAPDQNKEAGLSPLA